MTELINDIYEIRRWPFDQGLPKLIIKQDYIEYKDIRIEKTDIVEYRHGVRWLSGLKFTIGRDYQIFIKSKNGQIMKISFMTFYGINKKELWEKYIDILNKTWNYYFSKITDEYLEKFYDGQTIIIADVKISLENVVFKSTVGFKEKEVTVDWDNLGAKDYVTYFALYSKTDSANINRGFKFKDVWNAGVLQSFINYVLTQRSEKMSNP